ncbi:MAG TPA: hypothetical protein VH105_15965 [Burkholderiales bacterium]|jgi:hypothetical protein|nr:hypothetical protein [Burkholderiales bacterium]
MEEEPLGPLERPSPQAALFLLVPAALCSGLFYLWLRQPGESIVYGCLLGGGLAAMGLELVKYARWLRENPDLRDSSATGAFMGLVLGAFRLGFMRTAIDLAKAFAQLFGFKALASIVVVFLAFLAARAGHWF